MLDHFSAWQACLARNERLWRIRLSVGEQLVHMTLKEHFKEWLCAVRDRRHGAGCLRAMVSKSGKRRQISALARWSCLLYAARDLSCIHASIAQGHACWQKSNCYALWAGFASSSKSTRAIVAQLSSIGRTGLMHDVMSAWLAEVTTCKVDRIASVLDQGEDDIRPLLRPLVEKCLQQASRKTFGWCWRGAGNPHPAGQKLINSKLAAALKGKTVFSEEEWLEFGIQGLKADHYIKSGSCFYKPLGVEACAQVLAGQVLHLERAARLSRLFGEDIDFDVAAQLLGNADRFFLARSRRSHACITTCMRRTKRRRRRRRMRR